MSYPALIFAFVLGLILTPLSRRLGNSLGLIDLPQENKIHKEKVARSGGIAIYFSLWLSYFIFYPIDSFIISIFSIGSFIFILGLIDDKYNLKPKSKLFLEILILFVLLYLLNLPHKFFNLLVLIVVLNAFNLMDGLNGLASLICIAISSGLWLLLFPLKVSFIYTLLIGVMSSFLIYNLRKDYIFMGDGGSLFLGFLLGMGIVLNINRDFSGKNLLFSSLLVFIPLSEIFITIIRRFLKGDDIFQPDLGHIYNILLNWGLKEKQILLIYFLLNIAIVFLIFQFH